jgi:hypothetical protein
MTENLGVFRVNIMLAYQHPNSIHNMSLTLRFAASFSLGHEYRLFYKPTAIHASRINSRQILFSSSGMLIPIPNVTIPYQNLSSVSHLKSIFVLNHLHLAGIRQIFVQHCEHGVMLPTRSNFYKLGPSLHCDESAAETVSSMYRLK